MGGWKLEVFKVCVDYVALSYFVHHMQWLIRWICGFTFKEKKKVAELKALLVLEPVNLVIKKRCVEI